MTVDQATKIIRETLHDGLLWDFIRALELALFRTFAAPRIGELLNKTGEFRENGQKRYDDTTLLLLTMLRDGIDSVLGEAAIARMNRSHGHYNIRNEDFLFVLSTFVIDPIMWCKDYAWRPLSDEEQLALFTVWREVGVRMGLQDLPDTLTEMETHSWGYVANEFAHSNANQATGMATIRIVEGWLPAPFRPLVAPAVASLIDKRTRKGIGLSKPPRPYTFTVLATLKGRQLIQRLVPPLRFRGRANWPDGKRTYPDGYRIEDLAPERLKAAEARLKQQ